MKHFRYNRNSSDIQIKFKRPGIETSVSILVSNVPLPASSPTTFKCAILSGTTVNRAKRAGKFSVDHRVARYLFRKMEIIQNHAPLPFFRYGVYLEAPGKKATFFFFLLSGEDLCRACTERSGATICKVDFPCELFRLFLHHESAESCFGSVDR